MKLLVIYNTCELRGIGNIPFYVNSIQSILMQRLKEGDSLKVCISACAPSDMWVIQSRNTFHDHISYNFIKDHVPVSVTFNDSVEKMHQLFGDFDATLYLDSGITFWDPTYRYDAIQTLIDVHQSGPYALTAAFPSNDSGHEWWGIPEYDDSYVFPLGKTTNLHVQLFDRRWRDAYGRILPDCFASHCMESAFTGMAAAIHRKFVITKRVNPLHIHSLDGASSSTLGQQKADRFPMSQTFDCGGQWFKHQEPVEKKYQRGYHIGFALEECKPWWPHNPEAFDENGFAKHSELKDFFKKELYLSKEEFDYASLTSYFFPGK
jgi:hypothetical protein